MNARDIQKNQKTDKAINKNNAVGINISLGSTGWKDHAETITEETRGSTITAGRTAAIIAKERHDSQRQHSQRQRHLPQSRKRHQYPLFRKQEHNHRRLQSKSGSIGPPSAKEAIASARPTERKGQIEETTYPYPSDITAKNTVALSSGNDITIRGGTVKGNKVTANAGKNVHRKRTRQKITKKQARHRACPSATPGSAVTVSGGKGKQTQTPPTKALQNRQASMQEKKDTTSSQNNTRLKGAVIDSQAEKEKNRITTGTLTWENIDNKAEYKASGKESPYPPIPYQTQLRDWAMYRPSRERESRKRNLCGHSRQHHHHHKRKDRQRNQPRHNKRA